MRAGIPGRVPLHSGKVREMYDLGDEILMVTTDRLSAFDVVFPTPIPHKGRVLTQLSLHWFRTLRSAAPHHLIAEPDEAWLRQLTPDPAPLLGRCLRVRKCQTVPIECVVRGNLEGSAWKEYQQRQAIQEHPLPPGLRLHDALPEPLFTPSTKAESGHDLNITLDKMRRTVGSDVAALLRQRSLDLFAEARERLAAANITLADTKFEFGWFEGQLVLIDEVLTPDSSRFLVLGDSGEPVSLDKQYVRDWAAASGWNCEPPAPPLPAEVVQQTSQRYLEIARRIMGRDV
ncbi:MAG: phosphoribosylaminoimidazolesuccinocarboxamide synthase [Candidatus Sumerlaeia bacterium]|nr:phosphoribosylaminoimidazolesuccinocarboxamide synthase [Candidatus Sumerlaeia bacterium]